MRVHPSMCCLGTQCHVKCCWKCEWKSDKYSDEVQETPFSREDVYDMHPGIGMEWMGSAQSHFAQHAPPFLPGSTPILQTAFFFLFFFAELCGTSLPSSRNRILPRFWCITSRPDSLSIPLARSVPRSPANSNSLNAQPQGERPSTYVHLPYMYVRSPFDSVRGPFPVLAI